MRINLLDRLASKGNTFTFEEFVKLSNLSTKVVQVLLYRLEKNGWIERIERGKYIIIPLGAEKGKCTLND